MIPLARNRGSHVHWSQGRSPCPRAWRSKASSATRSRASRRVELGRRAEAPRRADRRPQRRAERARPSPARAFASFTLTCSSARTKPADERAHEDRGRADSVAGARAARRSARARGRSIGPGRRGRCLLGRLAAEWKRDLDVVVHHGRDREQATANDPVLLRYRVDRAKDAPRAAAREGARVPRARP